MPFNAIVSSDDLKRGDLLEPGWYQVETVSYDEKPAESDKSTNCIFQHKVIQEVGRGVQVRSLFNEKALGFGKKYYAAVGVEKDANGGYNLSTSVFRNLVGSKLEVYVARGVSNKGNEFNEIKDYRPFGG